MMKKVIHKTKRNTYWLNQTTFPKQDIKEGPLSMLLITISISDIPTNDISTLGFKMNLIQIMMRLTSYHCPRTIRSCNLECQDTISFSILIRVCVTQAPICLFIRILYHKHIVITMAQLNEQSRFRSHFIKNHPRRKAELFLKAN